MQQPSQSARSAKPHQRWIVTLASHALCLALLLLTYGHSAAMAHGVSSADQRFIEASQGPQLIPFAYLGAKHMVTGYDHILFLVGVIFFLFRPKQIATYVTLFSVGHSTTLLLGVLMGVNVNAFLVDAVIGLSVVYKGLDNLGYLKQWLGFQPNTKAAVLLFGLIHGFGLATKLQDFTLSQDGLIANIVSFNLGVELGQIIALGVVLIAMGYWRRSSSFTRYATLVNIALVLAGLGLTAYQLAGFAGLLGVEG